METSSENGLLNFGIRQKVLLVLFAVLVISLSISGWVELEAEKKVFQHSIQQRGNDISKYVAKSLGYSVVGYDYHTVQLLLDEVTATEDVVYARVLTVDGKVMGHSGERQDDDTFVLFTRPIIINDDQIGSLELGLSTVSAVQLHEQRKASLLRRQALVIVFTLLAEFLALSLIIISPVRAITREFGKMSAVNTGAIPEIPNTRRDEFGQMARQFNQLVRRLNDTHQKLQSKIELADKRLVSKNRQLLKKSNELREINNKLRGLSITDQLTGLYNRRHFDQHLAKEVAIAKRYSQPTSLLLIDLDHFKQVNDNHGHAVGDAVLKNVAGLLMDSVREMDVLCRIGGEEFAVLCKKTTREQALLVAEKIRTGIEENSTETAAGRLSVTVSIGVATLPSVFHSSEDKEFFACADRALYWSKQSGRNRATHCDEINQGTTANASVTTV